MFKRIAIVLILFMIVCIVELSAAEYYSYSYDANTETYKEVIDDDVYYYEEFNTSKASAANTLKATSVTVGSNGWSVECSEFGTDCWDTILDIKERYEEL